jgi:ketosteroid isomerase-like protein
MNELAGRSRLRHCGPGKGQAIWRTKRGERAMPSDKIAVVTEFMNRLGRMDIAGAAELLTEDAVMALPYLEQLDDLRGRDAIVRQIEATMVQMLEAMHFTFAAWYEATDGETVIGEYTSKCPIRGRDAFYENAYVGIFKLREGKVALYREYLNPAKLDIYAGHLNG